MELNSWMSVAEAGVVLGVLLEGSEYIPAIHKRWPALEKIGFLILVVALVADWRFQSMINERQTQALVAAYERIVRLSPRPALMNNKESLAALSNAASRYAGQKFEMFVNMNTADDREEVALTASQIDAVFAGAGWLGPSGRKIEFPNGIGSNVGYNPPKHEGVHGILFETASDAPTGTSEAADEMVKALTSLGLFAYHNKTSTFEGLSVPSRDVIVITVARRLEL